MKLIFWKIKRKKKIINDLTNDIDNLKNAINNLKNEDINILKNY